MLLSRTPLLSLRQAAERAGVHRCTIQFWSDFEGLTTIRDERGYRFVREAELQRFLAERAKRQAIRGVRAEERRQEQQARRDRWLADIAARHGLVPAANREVAA